MIAKVVSDFRAAILNARIYVYDNNSTDQSVEHAQDGWVGARHRAHMTPQRSATSALERHRDPGQRRGKKALTSDPPSLGASREHCNQAQSGRAW